MGYNGPLNKQQIIKEYKRRVNKIWKSELNAINKSIAHNSFAVPIITQTIGILNWTKQEIKNLDIATRKLLTMNGSFHQSSDTNRLYAKRKDGGRGIKNIEDLYECRTIALMEHLEKAGEAHGLLKLVKEHEKQGIVRLGYEFKERIKEISKSSDVTEGTKKIHKKEWIGKVTHGYHQSQIEGQEEIDSEQTNNWLNLHLTSHLEGFVCAMQEQEIDMKSLRKRREKDQEKRKRMDNSCRVRGKAEENLFHVLGACPILAPTLYLKSRHNQVAKIIYQEKMKLEKLIEPPEVTKTNDAKMRWDKKIKTVTKIEHNRPDMIYWNLKDKQCEIIEISVPLDNNKQQAYKLKQGKYIELISQLQRMYKGFKYNVIVITVGCLGAIPVNLKQNLLKAGIEEDKIRTVTHRIQRAALLGTIRIGKTILNM